MRFHATDVFKFVLLPALALMASVVVSGQSNICNCPKPPGGETHCAANQVAFCSVKSGQVVGTCVTPPPTASSGGPSREKMQAEALSIIFDTDVSVSDLGANSRYQSILRSEGVRTSDAAVTSSIPNGTATPTNSQNGKHKVSELPEASTEDEKKGIRKFSEFSGFVFNRMIHSPPPPRP